MNQTFDPQTLADDLRVVRCNYARFFAGLTAADWERPVKRGPNEWNLHETVAHLCGLTGAGLESITQLCAAKPMSSLDSTTVIISRAYNRRGIDEHLPLPMNDLCAEFLDILDQTANIAVNLQPGQR